VVVRLDKKKELHRSGLVLLVRPRQADASARGKKRGEAGQKKGTPTVRDSWPSFDPGRRTRSGPPGAKNVVRLDKKKELHRSGLVAATTGVERGIFRI